MRLEKVLEPVRELRPYPKALGILGKGRRCNQVFILERLLLCKERGKGQAWIQGDQCGDWHSEIG